MFLSIWDNTDPIPYVDASLVNIIGLFGLKCVSTLFDVIYILIVWNAFCQSLLKLKFIYFLKNVGNGAWIVAKFEINCL